MHSEAPAPLYHERHDELAALARWLRDGRAQSDPGHVAKGKMTQEDAARRLRVLNAICALWDAKCARAPIPALDASYTEMHDELAAIAAVAAESKGQSGPYEAAADLPAALKALVWQHSSPPGFTSPRIVLLHDLNLDLSERARQHFGRAA